MPEMIDNAQFHFRYGQCHAFAIALHRRTRLPLGFIVGLHGDPAAPETEVAKPVVMVGETSFLDVDGFHEKLDLVMLNFTNSISSVKLVPATIRDVASFFGEGGIRPDMVQAADRYIEEDEGLNDYFGAHRGVDLSI